MRGTQVVFLYVNIYIFFQYPPPNSPPPELTYPRATTRKPDPPPQSYPSPPQTYPSPPQSYPSPPNVITQHPSPPKQSKPPPPASLPESEKPNRGEVVTCKPVIRPYNHYPGQDKQTEKPQVHNNIQAVR